MAEGILAKASRVAALAFRSYVKTAPPFGLTN